MVSYLFNDTEKIILLLNQMEEVIILLNQKKDITGLNRKAEKVFSTHSQRLKTRGYPSAPSNKRSRLWPTLADFGRLWR